MRIIFLKHLVNKKSVLILILLMVVPMAIVVLVGYEHFDSGAAVRVDNRWAAEIWKYIKLYEEEQESDSKEQEKSDPTFLLSLREKLNDIVNSASDVEELNGLENVHKENGNDDKENNFIKEEAVTSSTVAMKSTINQDRKIPTEKVTENQEVTESSRGHAGVPHEDESRSIQDNIKQENPISVTQERSKCTWDLIIVKFRLMLEYQSPPWNIYLQTLIVHHPGSLYISLNYRKSNFSTRFPVKDACTSQI